jgi:hypothetical protein
MANGNNGHRIPAPIIPDTERKLVRFSFKYVDLESAEFGPQHCNDECLRVLIQKLHEYSSWPLDAFLEQDYDAHRHIISFSETRFPDGFTNVTVDQLDWEQAWQFAICPDRPWRVYGLLVDEEFFIIWIDPHHRLYNAYSNRNEASTKIDGV